MVRGEPVSPCVGGTCPRQGRLRLASEVTPMAEGAVPQGRPSTLPPCPPVAVSGPPGPLPTGRRGVPSCPSDVWLCVAGCLTHCAHSEGVWGASLPIVAAWA